MTEDAREVLSPRRCAGTVEFAAMVRGDMFDDGEAQTRAAARPARRRIDAVKALREPWQMFRRNAGLRRFSGSF